MNAQYDIHKIEIFAQRMRKSILDISYACNLSTHLGGGLSMVEIMATLYAQIMRYDPKNPRWSDRDRFILSKGHGVLGYFSALYVLGVISDDIFKSFQTNESDLIAHPVMNLDLGIESSNGSLGQGLSMAVGLALAAQRQQMDHRVYVLLGDGECNEGAVWEAVMLAPQLRLSNLCAMVDYNGLQSDGHGKDIVDFGDLSQKWASFGWQVFNVNGHSIHELLEAFEAPVIDSRPKAIIANTVKGKGISFMERNNEWHHNRLTKSFYEKALEELGVARVGN
jgi:transketolase